MFGLGIIETIVILAVIIVALSIWGKKTFLKVFKDLMTVKKDMKKITDEVKE